MNELQYRVNFAFSLVQSLVAVGTSIAVLALVFGHTDSLDGWTGDELLVVMGVYVLVGGLIKMIVQPNMQQLMDGRAAGDARLRADQAGRRPAAGQRAAVQIWQGVDVVVGGVVVVVATLRLPAGDRARGARLRRSRWCSGR